MSDKLFRRVLDGKCPICDKDLKADETEVVVFNKGKLEVHKRHIKYKRK